MPIFTSAGRAMRIRGPVVAVQFGSRDLLLFFLIRTALNFGLLQQLSLSVGL